MLDQIVASKQFKLFQKGPPATVREIDELRSYLGDVPKEYVGLVSEGTDVELGHDSGRYKRIWGPGWCVNMDEGYHFRKWMPNVIPIGDNGGCVLIFYARGSRGVGLYNVGFGDVDLDEAVWIASSLFDLLVLGDGVESIDV